MQPPGEDGSLEGRQEQIPVFPSLLAPAEGSGVVHNQDPVATLFWTRAWAGL